MGSWVNMTGLLVNMTEMLGCMMGWSDYKKVMLGYMMVRLVSSQDYLVSSLDCVENSPDFVV